VREEAEAPPAFSPDDELNPGLVLRLQRSAGNAAVSRLVRDRAAGRGRGRKKDDDEDRPQGFFQMVLAWARKQLGLGEAEAQKALDEKDEAPTKAGGKANGKVRPPDGKAKAGHGGKGGRGAGERARAPRPHPNGKRPAGGAPAPVVPNVVPEGGRRPKTPEEDPAFRAVKARIGAAGEATKDHPPSESKAAEAQAAAKGPPNEVQSQAKGAQVDDMAAQKPGSFDKKAFMAAVHKAVEAATPKNLKQVSDFAESGKAGEVGDRVAGMVTQNKEAAERGIKDTTAAQPDPSRGEAKAVVPMQEEQPGAPPAPVAAASGMPPPATAQETDLSKGPAEVDKELKENEVTEEQLQASNEPDMQQAVDAKKDAEKHSTEAPKAYRAEEAAILGKAKTESEQEAAAGLGGMHKSKVSALTQIAGSKTHTKSADEAKRAKVATDLEAIYGKTKTDVTKILDGIEPKVTSAFDTGEQAARQDFESYVDAQMTAYKDDRYSGWRGKLRWFRDKLLGMPDAVNRFYETGKSRYIAAMDGVISNVADIVGTDLDAAHARIAQGQAEVKKYVTGLPKDLKKLGNEAAAEMGRRFQQLESDVDAKSEDLVQTIANKYVESSGNLDKRIEELKEANKGLVDKAIGFVKGAIETIRKLKDLLMNVLRKAISVIGDILRHPIRFIENFMSGVKDGLHLFTDKIGSYLEDALIGWLFGPSVLGGRAIEKPQSLDFKGVVSLVLQVLGLTKDALLDRLTKKVGAPAVDKLKKGVEWIGLLITEGPAGLWKWVQQKVGDLYETVIGGIKDWVVTKVIKAGITWLIGLLNPAGALVKIVKAIVDVVTFIFERAEQIADFINAVLDAVIDVAKGNLGGVAKKIADGLGKGLSLAIGFLASLLGLGGIGETVRGIIDKVRAPIKNLVDGLIDSAVRMAKRLGMGIKSIGKRAVGWVKGKAAGIKERIVGPRTPEDEAAYEKRLDKAEEELKPKVAGMVANGTSRPVMKAKALGWSARYRVRVSVQTDDAETRVIARTQRERKLAEHLISLEGERLSRMIREVAKEILEEKEVQIQLEQIVEDREKGYGTPEHPRVERGGAAEAQSIIKETRRPGQAESILMGGQWGVAERQTRSRRPGHILVEELGTYPEIAGQLTELKAAGLSNADIADAVLALGRGEHPGGIFEQRPELGQKAAEVTRLMFQVEAGRSPSALVTSPMAIETIAGSGGDIEAGVTELHPMSPEGAVAAGRGVGQIVGVPVPTTVKSISTAAKRERMMEMERKAAEAYVYTLIMAQKPLYQTGDQWERFIKHHFRDYLKNMARPFALRTSE
jgi:hypothetical protein